MTEVRFQAKRRAFAFARDFFKMFSNKDKNLNCNHDNLLTK